MSDKKAIAELLDKNSKYAVPVSPDMAAIAKALLVAKAQPQQKPQGYGVNYQTFDQNGIGGHRTMQRFLGAGPVRAGTPNAGVVNPNRPSVSYELGYAVPTPVGNLSLDARYIPQIRDTEVMARLRGQF